MLNQLTPTRFAASIVVVLFHFGHGIPMLASPWAVAVLRDGPLAVSWFFALSGFLMAFVYSQMQPREAADYWWRRFARIYPLYLLALIGYGVISSQGLRQEPVDWFLNVTLLQAWIPGHALSLNAPGWSLSVEASFYAAFPYLIGLARQVGLTRWCGYVALCWLLSQAIQLIGANWLSVAFPSRLHDLLYYFPLCHLNAFLMGMTGALLVRRFRPGPWTGLSMTVLGVGMSALVALHGPAEAARYGARIVLGMGLLAPLFTLALCGLATANVPPLRWPALLLLGEASYAVYLFQLPGSIVWSRVAAPYFGAGATVDFAAYLISLVTFAIAAHVAVERPCRNWLRSVRPSPPGCIPAPPASSAQRSRR